MQIFMVLRLKPINSPRIKEKPQDFLFALPVAYPLLYPLFLPPPHRQHSQFPGGHT